MVSHNWVSRTSNVFPTIKGCKKKQKCCRIWRNKSRKYKAPKYKERALTDQQYIKPATNIPRFIHYAVCIQCTVYLYSKYCALQNAVANSRHKDIRYHRTRTGFLSEHIEIRIIQLYPCVAPVVATVSPRYSFCFC